MSSAEVRVLVYNIQNYEGNWQSRLPIIAEAIDGADVDIVVLNEVRGHYDGTANQAEELRGALYGYWHLNVCESMDYTPPFFPTPSEWEGVAIISRQHYPMLSNGSRALSTVSGDANRRVVQHASFQVYNSRLPLTIFNLHATLDDGAGYDRNLQEVLDYTREFEGPALLCGDLNQPHQANLCDTDGPCIPPKLQPLVEAGWTDMWMAQAAADGNTDPGYTWKLTDSGAAPTKRLDYQWGNTALVAGARLKSMQLFLDKPIDGHIMSDHAGVLAVYQF
eukprot:TRINITY_DN25421_c0_g1_i1.p1 TRINITY_DN25421_c0_g1~~TRINITY_DN25421_c0_g1_i1.p1  ORF type:complete len:278 (+),score=79.57 TRINITY_DN25421_c0_g1_i1:209-1042(+)